MKTYKKVYMVLLFLVLAVSVSILGLVADAYVKMTTEAFATPRDTTYNRECPEGAKKCFTSTNGGNGMLYWCDKNNCKGGQEISEPMAWEVRYA